jgi:polyhydroxyalkanoate synthesis regulator phasin
MAQIDGLKRYLDAGIAMTKVTRERAEKVVRDLIQEGQIDASRAQEWVEDLVSTSHERSEAFISSVRSEVRSQLAAVGVTDLDELARRVARVLERGQAAARKAAKRPSRPKPVVKKAPAKKTAAKKTAAKKAPAKKAPAKKAPAKKTAAKKAAAKRAPAKKTVAKRAPAKKAVAKRAGA